MVVDSNSTRRSKDDRTGNNSKKKLDISKGESSLRRSTRGTPVKEQATLTSSAMETPKVKASKLIDSSSMKKSDRVEKKDTSPPVKRKLEVLENEKKSSSPLRRSDRGNKNPTLPSSDSNNNAKVTASPDDKMKELRKDKSVKDLLVEATKTSEEAKTVERPNGRIRKTRNAHTYIASFAPQKRRGVVPELKRAEKLSQDDKACLGGVSGDGKDGTKECSEKIEEECVENSCKGGNEQSVPRSDNAKVLTLNDHGKLESSCLNSKSSSREALGEPSQENGVNASKENMIREEVIEDSGKLLLDNASVVELQTSEVERLPDNNVAKGTVIASLPLSECEKDKFVGTCTSCYKRRRLNNNSSVKESCLCSIVPINDSPRTSRSEDGVVRARCNDSHNDALNDGNLSTRDVCVLDGELTPDSSKFVEYWVPVSTSNVQLEHYCAALLSNSTALRAASSSKDIVGTLHDILISTKKCCDHPYFMDKELQGFLTKDLPAADYLGVGIKASGKLQLLDTVLSEIKGRGKRVLILYQSIRHADILIGDILDDYLRQRFSLDAYERVDGGIVQSKKQAALQKFNDKNGGRFVFLLEKRACTSAIKLSYLDAIVIFDSDWNIKNDNRALDKLSIDQSPEPIKVFRFYTFCTLEEKVLELASERVALDSNVQSIGRMTCHSLLTWGASYLFGKLDEFHSGNTSNKGLSLCPDITMEKDVAGQLLDIIIHNAQSSCKNSLITKVQFSEGTYSKNAPLYGQLKVKSTDEKPFHQFWNELLEGKKPRWRFSPVHSQRNRKRVNLPTMPDGEPDELTKKQKKIVRNSSDVASPRMPDGEPNEVTKKQKKIVRNSSDVASPGMPDGEPYEVTKKLKKIVRNSSDVASPRTRPAEGSLVASPKSTASMPFSSKNISPASEVPIDGSEEETKVPELRKNLHGLLKPTILKLSELVQIPEDVKTVGNVFLEYIVKNHQISTEPKSILQAFQLSLIQIAASLLNYNLDREQLLDVAKQQLSFCCTEEDVMNVFTKLRPLRKAFKKNSQKFKELESKKDSSEDRLKKIQRKCEKRKKRLLRKHEEEIQVLNKTWDEKIAKIHCDHNTELVVIRAMYFSDPARRSDVMKKADDQVRKKLDEHDCEKELRLQELKQKQLDEIIMEDKKAAGWLKHAQENGVSISGEKQSLDLTETTMVAPSSIPITSASEIPTIPSESLHETSTMEKQLGKNVISGNRNSIVELVPDGLVLGAKETVTKTLNEIARDAESLHISKPDKESSKDNNLRNKKNISDLDRTENRSDAAGSSRNEDIRTVPSLVTSPPVHILEGAAQDVASLQTLVPDDECSRPSISAGILVGDAIKCENTDDLEQVRSLSGAKEADKSGQKKLVGDTKSSDTSKPDGESQEDNSLRSVIYISDSEPTEDCTDTAGGDKQDGTVQPVKILEAPQDIAPLQNLVELQDESRPSISVGILDGDATGCKDTNTLQQAENDNHTSTEEQILDGTSSGVQGTENDKHTLTEEQILDGPSSGVQGAVEKAANELARDAKSSDSLKTDGESNENNNLSNNVNISDSSPMKNCTDVAGTVPPSVISPSVQIEASGQDVESLQILAPQSESRPPISPGALDIVATECENTNALEQAAAENIPDCTTSSAQEVVGNAPNEFENTNVVEETTEKISDSTIENARNEFENANALAQTAPEKIPDCTTSSAQEAVENIPNEIENNRVVVQAEVEHPSQELPPSQNGEQSTMQFVDNLLPQLGTNIVDEIRMGILPPFDTPVAVSRTHHPPSHPSPQMHPRPQPHHSRLDPLQFELERLQRAAEEFTKLHEVTKLKLKSEHEKELEELRRKYEAKLKSAENEFMQKKKKLDTYHSKVFMNRILADTFRAKCLELKPSTSSGIHKAKSTSFVEQLLSQHQPQRSAVLNPPNFVPPAASPQIAGPSVPRPSPTIPNMQMRPPHTLPNMTRPIRNFPNSAEIRAMPPHLRPPSSTLAPTQTQGLPGQDPRRQSLFAALTQFRPRMPVPVPPQHNRVPQPENMGIHHLVPVSGTPQHNRVPQSENMPIWNPVLGPPQTNRVLQPENMASRNPVLGTPQNNRVLQPENMATRNPVPVPPQKNQVPPSENTGMRNPVPGSNFVELYLSRGGAQGGDRGTGVVNLTPSSGANEVVNLSDDEL